MDPKMPGPGGSSSRANRQSWVYSPPSSVTRSPLFSSESLVGSSIAIYTRAVAESARTPGDIPAPWPRVVDHT